MCAQRAVAEDENALVTLLRYNLEREGYRVLEAQDGEEALLVASKQKPDLVLLDWMLPQLSGIEVCRRLRGRQETRNVPIIMLTARGEETDRIRGLDTGADDYLTKPFSMTELLARLRAVMRRIRPSLAEDCDRRLATSKWTARRIACADAARDASGADGVQAARSSDPASRPRLQPRAAARRGVGLGRLCRSAHGRRACGAPAQGAQHRQGARDPIRTVRSAGYALDDTFYELSAGSRFQNPSPAPEQT